MQQWPDFIYEGEFKEGKRHGYSTVYFRKRTDNYEVFNMIHEEGREIYKELVTDPSKARFGDGLSLDAKYAKNEMMENYNRFLQ